MTKDPKLPDGRFIAYYRVSTRRQAQSGLGLEAQREAVRTYLANGGWPPLAEFVEVESGRRNDRPKLQKALVSCRLHNATLIIAKLDRLSRDVEFTANLMNSDVDFVAVDFPQANRLTIHILAAVAEHEREMISKRTKDALAAAKARGVKLGNDGSNLSNRSEGSAKGVAAIRAKAESRARDLLPVIREIQSTGAGSLRKIAAVLNDRAIPTARGRQWSAVQVQRVIQRAEQQS